MKEKDFLKYGFTTLDFKRVDSFSCEIKNCENWAEYHVLPQLDLENKKLVCAPIDWICEYHHNKMYENSIYCPG